MPKSNFQRPLDTTTFRRLRKWYILALTGIALTIIIAQILIQVHLNSQLDDSRVINVAGRQRAYSQKLTKEALLLKDAVEPDKRELIISELHKTLQVWKTSHHGLQRGDTTMHLPKEKAPEILGLFQELEPHHSKMVHAVEAILDAIAQDGKIAEQTLKANTTILLENERPFLNLMDVIVNEYDQRSKEKLQNLKQKEYLLLAFSLLILILEMLFIFRPLTIQIRNTISDLMKSQSESEINSKRIETLLFEKEKSLKELQELNFVIDNAALFASAKKDGSIVFISKKFLTLLGIENEELNKPLSELLTADEGQQQYLKEILKSNRKNSIRKEEIQIKTLSGSRIWLDISIIPLHQASKEQSILILCSDITERKKNLLKVEQLTQQNFEERMRQKKMQASQIVEGQEEERKRISKDIHDGIGQMLTALKFNIESIDIENKEKTIEKIAYLKNLTADLIKGVRTATFNLTPPELSDHGIFPAIHKMTVELSKLTGKTILFENKAKENIRFDSLAETNIYRVTQEAVNNAIKYANAGYILVTINFNNDMLSVVIDDDGQGFDPSILTQVPKNNSEGGMGLFFMKERISYINGRLFINSELGKGTRITINYKTDKSTE
ncbi:ATP-binding protein [Maribacter polysaccharolyticus]|uniref:sensor histidine kinase n=1 Tax=Maribacter polysaccharolyticus TaxID=3020831 RepID=UPI00237F7F44|nr:ATP-binding protein [Maribacter polysaccharolyticus]MDE3742475.1 type IV pili methyl-accepting chemotaxis transducer N-terminal domain-containing protein [Maribacter polysaccharolyticus]